jgi:hypothetical protein
MKNAKPITFLKVSASIIGSILFFICGLFMIMWGNLAGDLWPIPENPAPLWIRIPIGLVFFIISVYFLKSAKTNERK